VRVVSSQISRKSSQIIRTTDERWIPVFLAICRDVRYVWGRLPGSEQSQLLLYQKFSVFRYHTYEQSCIVLTNVSKKIVIIPFDEYRGIL